MRQWLRISLTLSEIGMLTYWALAIVVVLGVISVPPERMYSDYEKPLVVSWNWSFFPLDMIFAISGLFARFLPMHPVRREVLAVFSLSLMFCAGLMAIAFWVIQQAFDPFWWGVNLWLILLSSIALGRKLVS